MDGIFGIGPLELLFIAILALIVLGPERLPGVMRELAKYIRQFRRVGSELTAQFSEELKVLDEINPRKILNDMTDPNRPDPDEPKIAAKPAAPVKPATPPPPKPTTKPTTKPAPAKPVVDTSTAAASESPAPEEAERRIPPPAPVEAQPQPAPTFDNPGNGHAPAADPAVLGNGAADGPENPA
jgi:sec-independent protein translocase protein TatB